MSASRSSATLPARRPRERLLCQRASTPDCRSHSVIQATARPSYAGELRHHLRRIHRPDNEEGLPSTHACHSF